MESRSSVYKKCFSSAESAPLTFTSLKPQTVTIKLLLIKSCVFDRLKPTQLIIPNFLLDFDLLLNTMIKTFIASLLLLSVFQGSDGGPLAAGICYAGCAGVTVACFSAAGFTFGTVPFSIIAATPALAACNTAFGACEAACMVCLLWIRAIVWSCLPHRWNRLLLRPRPRKLFPGGRRFKSLDPSGEPCRPNFVTIKRYSYIDGW